MPLGFIGAEFTLKEPIAVTEFKARSLLTKMDYMLFGTGLAKLLSIKATSMCSFCKYVRKFGAVQFTKPLQSQCPNDM